MQPIQINSFRGNNDTYYNENVCVVWFDYSSYDIFYGGRIHFTILDFFTMLTGRKSGMKIYDCRG